MLQSLFGLFCLLALSHLVSLTGANDKCPVKFNPERVVVEFGSSVSVNCSTNVTHDGMGWEANEGSGPMSRTNLTTWRLSSLRRWDSTPQCYLNYRGQCESFLPITVYKTPDRVSIITVDLKGPMIEGSLYELQCDVVNVAPAQNLIVKWYKGEILVHRETFTDTIKTPVNKTSTLQITPNRTDDGVQYRCEAELELGAEGPQPTPKVTSERLHITVQYPPRHISLMKTINKIEGEVTLNCTVAANPAATYSWNSDHLKETIRSSVFSSSTLSPGNYTCTAKNSLGTSSKVFIINSAGSHPIVTYLIVLQLLVAFRIII